MRCGGEVQESYRLKVNIAPAFWNVGDFRSILRNKEILKSKMKPILS